MNMNLSFGRRIGRFLLPIGAAFALFTGGCSDDPVAAPPTGNSSITILHANPAYTSDVTVKRENASLIATLTYGTPQTAVVPNGNSTIKFVATDGTELASAQAQADSTKSIWVIMAGTADKREGFAVVTKKITPSGANAAVRVINGSETAPPIKVLLNDATGPSLTSGSIPYKSGSDFVSVPAAATTSLVIVNNNSSNVVLNVPLTLEAGKQYTVVMFGSANVTGQYGLQAKVLQDVQ